MNLEQYLRDHVTHWSRPTLDPKSFGALKYSTPLTPADYLQFSEKDLRLGGPRGLVNSLANAKRAIDCQVFSILNALGIAEPRTFPDRLTALTALGLLGPRVVRKVVQLRNVLEHKYYKPTRVEVEDALDVTALFLESFKPYFVGSSYMDSCWLADEDSANPRAAFERTKTHTIWRHDQEPRFPYADGMFLESDLNEHSIELTLVHNNVELTSVTIEPCQTGYLEVQAFLLRADIEDLAFNSKGARRLLKSLQTVVAA